MRPSFTYFGFRYVRVTGWPGEVKNAIISFQKGDAVACTIGAGGAAGTTISTSSEFACSFEGAAGAIFIQYIGESL